MAFLKKIINSCWDIYKIIKYAKRVNYAAILSDKPSLILAGGPSLKTDILGLDMTGFNVSALNNFALHEIFLEVKPNNYMIADPVYWLEGEKYERFAELKYKLRLKFVNEVSWQMTFWVPFFAKKAGWINEIANNNSNIKICYYNLIDFKGFNSLKYLLYDRGLGAPKAQTVLIQAIFNSIWMGSKHISIAGADHNWLDNIYVGADNHVYLSDNHFDKNDNASYKPWLDYKGEFYKLHNLLIDLSKMFSGYHEIKKYSESRNIKVVNLTKDSYIDAFEKKK
jgi:hypothetical protein